MARTFTSFLAVVCIAVLLLTWAAAPIANQLDGATLTAAQGVESVADPDLDAELSAPRDAAVVGLGTVQLPLAGGNGYAEVEWSQGHARKHDQGTYPSSAIVRDAQRALDEYRRGNPNPQDGNGNKLRVTCYHSRMRAQYLVIVSKGDVCGGMTYAFDKGSWYSPTIFGGSECTTNTSCTYWKLVLSRDGYKPFFTIGG